MVEKYPGQIKIVFKNFPLGSHKLARPAAQAALAAKAQGKFWEYHDRLFATPGNQLNDALFKQIAVDLGLDLEQFDKDRNSTVINQQIVQETTIGRQAGVRGTPAIYINGLELKSRSVNEAADIIDSELARLRKQ